ncbi:MAG: sulfite exporter TauE/SafE family protein [Burkholderiaceae bacterium]
MLSPAALSGSLLAGFLATGHCLTMCGPMIANGTPTGPVIPIVASGRRPLLPWLRQAGRVSTYVVLGALAGGFGAALSVAVAWIRFESVLYLLFNVALIALGLHVFGVRLPAALESAALAAWKSVLAHAPNWLPHSGGHGPFLSGLVWGLVPCAAVYSVLPLALLSGSASEGAVLLFLFGIATIPGHLLLASAYRGARRAGKRIFSVWLPRAFGVAIVLWGLAGAGFALGLAERPSALLAQWCTAR